MPTNIMDNAQLNTLAVSDRRFDSIAWLIQGVDKCGAACFDGDNLLLATNNSQTVKFLSKIIDFLVDYTKACYDLRSSLQQHINKIRNSNSDDEAASEYFANIQRYQDLKKKNKDNISAIESYAYTHIKLYRLNPAYKKAFSDSLKKISRSISHTYFKVNSPKSLGYDFVEAIRNNRIVIQEGSTIHAEMKILESLLQNNKIFDNKKFYIGISKRCCRNCEKVIEAVNNITSLTITEDIDESSNRIQVRDNGHGIKFSSPIPSFLKNELIPGLKEEFLRLVEEDTLEEAFGVKVKYYDGPSQLHDRSGSEDSTSVESLEIVPFKVPASPATRFSDEIMQRLAALERKDKAKSSIEEVASYFIASKQKYVKQNANKNDGKLTRQTPLKEIKQNSEVKVKLNDINADKELIKMLAKNQNPQSYRSSKMINKGKDQFNKNDSQQNNKIEKKESKQIKPVGSNAVSSVSNPFLFAPRNFPSSEVKEGNKDINVNNEFIKMLARNRVTEYHRPSQERLNKEKSRSIGNESLKDKETDKKENNSRGKISGETSVLSPFFAPPLPAPKKIPPQKKSNTLPQVLSSKEVPKAVK